MILSNQARCTECEDAPYSAHVNDFQHCKCGAMAVDGGMEYLRRLGDPTKIQEMSIVVSEKHYALMEDAITDPERNSLGKVCNLVRVLRDDMNINIGEDT